jgi:pimeloyl-ACP methyl ester carboxylesterase
MTIANIDQMSVGAVTSRDGTKIGYLRVGHGPALVILHGSFQSARTHTQLALALSDAFTVYLPDRRGRGMSGPFGDHYSMRSEVEDVQAVLAESGASRMFGVSSSGIIALEAARTLPQIKQLAVYEPALLMDGTQHLRWMTRFDKEMADGKVGAALVTNLLGLELAPSVMRLMPRRLLAGFTDMTMKTEDKKAEPDAITMRKLAPTLHYEGVLLSEMEGTIDNFRTVTADVLLIGGTKGLAFLKPALDSLSGTLPHSQRVDLVGLDHGSSADASQTNPGGKPETVARTLRPFFTANAGALTQP